jgi:superfamily I DNA and/or RNA helicase
LPTRQHFQNLQQLLKLERLADLEQYRQKVLARSLTARVKEGTTWYPVKLNRAYIGTGERNVIELERTNQLEQPHTFSSGKSVSIFSNASGRPEKHHQNGVVNYVKDNLMVITLNQDELPDWIDNSLLGIDVMFDDVSYREMEYTLKKVMEAGDGRLAELREILVGNTSPHFDFYTMGMQQPGHPAGGLATGQLNPSQQKALKKIQSAKDVAIIHGPPGTGKTTTLTQSIQHCLQQESQVLVCAPSNAAVDLLVDKLSEMGISTLRIGHPARVTEQSLSKTLDARIAAHQHYSELKAMRKRMEELRAMAFKYKSNFGWEEKENRRLLLGESRVLKADADVLEFYIVNDLLQHTQAICCTLVGSSHPVLKGRKFNTVFIDEAAQALEPACWIPLRKANRVVLAGDHCQLPPTIKSIEAARQGLSVTLFERLIAKKPETATMLQVQYRMNQSIMAFSSKHFYKNELIADDSVKSRLLRLNQGPVEFIDTAGCGFTEKQNPETLSRYNDEEAALVIRLVEKLMEEITLDHWLEEKITLGIITPYSAQVELLVKLAEASPLVEPLLKLISINTVDAFQGQERDAIVISLVRSNDKQDVGFLGDIRRTNVAMTRARKKLIMVGDSATLGSHPFYLELIEFMQVNNFYKSVFEI